jgi:hypothetical protein
LLRAARDRRDEQLRQDYPAPPGPLGPPGDKGEDRSSWASGAQTVAGTGTSHAPAPLLARLQQQQAMLIQQLAQLADAIELLALDPAIEHTLIAFESFRYL